MRIHSWLIGAVGLALGAGCATKPDPNIATGAANAGVNEAAYPITIGPTPKDAPSKPLPPQKRMTQSEQIAAVQRSRMLAHIKAKMLEVIRRTHEKGRSLSATPPATATD